MTRTFTGVLPDGQPVLVTIFEEPEGTTAEIAFKEGEGRFARWGLPVPLIEQV